jgi:hypothetical protein
VSTTAARLVKHHCSCRTPIGGHLQLYGVAWRYRKLWCKACAGWVVALPNSSAAVPALAKSRKACHSMPNFFSHSSAAGVSPAPTNSLLTLALCLPGCCFCCSYATTGNLFYRTYAWNGWQAHVAWAAAHLCRYSASYYCPVAEQWWTTARASLGTSFGWVAFEPGLSLVSHTVCGALLPVPVCCFCSNLHGVGAGLRGSCPEAAACVCPHASTP